MPNLSSSPSVYAATKQAKLPISISENKSIIKNLVYVYGTRFISHLLQEDIGLSYKHFFPSIFTLSSSFSPITFRLRTGHCKLNTHLHRINLHPSGLCSTCFVSEDVEHVLLHCPCFSTPRNLFRSHLQALGFDFSFRSILSDNSEKYLLSFIFSSKLFIWYEFIDFVSLLFFVRKRFVAKNFFSLFFIIYLLFY